MKMPPPSNRNSEVTLPENTPKIRLDRWLVSHFPDCSRSEIQQWIKEGQVTSATGPLRPGTVVQPGMRLEIRVPEVQKSPVPLAEELPLEILFEDADLVALNKMPGQVVHPAPGHPGGTVLNAMLHHFPEMAAAGTPQRPGLVHRLDADTSGVLLFARNTETLLILQRHFKERRVRKIYHAVCHGIPQPLAQTLDLPIGRHPVHRRKRAVNGSAARNARTHFRLLKGVAGGTGGLLEVQIETGRTHQIRVHLAHAGHPVLGDRVYGGKKARLAPAWPEADRVMLHALSLELPHPRSGALLRVEAPYADDMTRFLNQL